MHENISIPDSSLERNTLAALDPSKDITDWISARKELLRTGAIMAMKHVNS